MALTIDNLQIQIESNARRATPGIDNLAKSLQTLKTSVGNSSGLASNLTQISNALKTFSGVGRINMSANINQLKKLQEVIPLYTTGQANRFASNIRQIGTAIGIMENFPKTNISSLANSLLKLNQASVALDSNRLARFSLQMGTVATSLSKLSVVGRGNIGPLINSLKKIPELTASLDTAILDAFADKMQRFAQIMAPLASEMDAVARGFNAMPRSVLRAMNATEKHTRANNRLSVSYGGLFRNLTRNMARFWTLYYTVQRVADVFADWFNESSEYIESLNLFNVSLGEASDAALEYAESVSEAMGIDVAEWITNQGAFTRMATGFGIASDQAVLMGQNLTQLAYDMSSFFNADVETAMDKLQSGMSGQIKGLKAWGYNLSVAALQETALSLGIEQSVRSMTEAQKAQLRYITLIQRSNGIMGDMAKTILSPSNSMRVLKAQLVELERALGNVVSVLLTRFIPWMMAGIEILTEFAEALAESWGFEVLEFPEVDLELGAEVEDEVDQAEDALNELKKQIMGFDELNILRSEKSEDKNTPSYDLGIKLPEYDFMKGLDGLDLQPFKEKLQDIFGVVKDIGIAFLGWKIAIGVHSFVTLFASSAIVTNILGFAEGFHLLRMEAGYSTWQSLTKTFSDLWNKIPKVTKALLGAGALIAAFALARDGAKELVEALNSESKEGLGGAFAKLTGGVAFGAIGGAMIGGPIGAVIGALATLALEIGTVLAEQEKLRVELSLTDYYDRQGASLAELKEHLVGYFASLNFEKQEEWRLAIESAQKSYDEAKEAYGEMYDTIRNKSELDTSEIDALTEAVNALAEASIALNNANLGAIMSSIKTAIDKNITSSLTEKLKELNSEILIAKQLLGEKIGSLQTEANVVIENIKNNNGQITNEDRNKLNHIIEQMDKFTLDSLTQQEIDREKYLNQEGKYNLGSDKEKVEEAIKDLKTDQDELVEMLEDQFLQDKHTLEQLIQMNKENNWGLNLSKSDIDALESAKNDAIKEVNEKYKEVFEAIAKNYESDARWNDSDFNTYYKKQDSTFLNWSNLNLGGQIVDWFTPGDVTGDTQIVWEQLELLEEILKAAGYTESQIKKKFKSWGIPGYASGGFPSMGQMFIAREAGPELVGRIGNKTAVANNDQITQGIASAVYSAMVAAREEGNNGGTSAAIIVQIDGKAVGEAAVKYVNGQLVQTGKYPFAF